MAYNGWTNYETWLVGVWDFIPWDSGIVTAQELQDSFEEYVDSFMPNNWAAESGWGLLTDLMSGAAANINWQELADNHNSGVDSE